MAATPCTDRSTLRMHVLSDIHLEFGNFRPKPTGADVVIAAGDIDQGSRVRIG